MAKGKKCAKCGVVYPSDECDANFGASETSCDGLQSYCNSCKNELGKRRQKKNVTARIRHHIATRVATQLGELAPVNCTKELEKHLGYTIRSLVRHLSADLREREGKKLRDALEEGYHIDHIHPLSKFPVIYPNSAKNLPDEVNWGIFRDCWRIENLMAIPAAENLAKGAKVL